MDEFDPLAEDESFTSAHALYRDLRERCPVARSTQYNGFWAVFRYEDVVQVLEDDDFTTSVQNVVPKFAFTGRRPPLHFDPPEHSAYRQIINKFFTRTRMAALEPRVRDSAAGVLQPLIDRGRCDIAADYARTFPAHVFAEFFNLRRELAELIKQISAEYVAAIQVVDDASVIRLSRRLYEIAAAVISERRASPLSPAVDLATALTQASYEGHPLPDDLVLAACASCWSPAWWRQACLSGTCSSTSASTPSGRSGFVVSLR